MRYRSTLSLLLALCFGAPSQAETLRFECPSSIQLESAKVVPVPGWETVDTPSTRTLENVQIYSGHPRGEMELAPNEESDGQSSQARWQFAQSDQELWIACSYRDTPVMLAKKLGKGVSSCVVRYQRLNSRRRARPQSISCS